MVVSRHAQTLLTTERQGYSRAYLESRAIPGLLPPDWVSLPSHQSLFSEGWWSSDLVPSKLLPGDSQVTFISVVSPATPGWVCFCDSLLRAVGGGWKLKLFLVKVLDKCHAASASVFGGL